MKIKSKFKDYYDYALVGIAEADKNIIYVREPIIKKENRNEKISMPSGLYVNIHSLKPGKGTFKSSFYVYFCGKIYKGIQEVDYEKKENSSLKLFADRYSYIDISKDEEDNIMKHFKTVIENYPIVVLKSFTNVKETYPNRSTGWQGEAARKDSQFKQEQTKVVLSDSLEYSIQYTINDCLKNVSFNKVMSAEIANQELELFLGLKQSNEVTVQFNDKDKIIQHGFNKESFRKRKGA